jgi:hypothetical protein
MKLLTDKIKRALPAIGATSELDPAEIRVPLKVFDPCGRGTWYITEYDGEDHAFGFCRSPLGEDCDELGFLSLVELQAVRNRFGMGMERDIHWDPTTTLDRVMNGEAR